MQSLSNKALADRSKSITRIYSGNESIVLIGFFGAGKRTLGIIAALATKRRFLDFDAFFQCESGFSPADYVAAHGPEQYRLLELETTARLLLNHGRGYVITGLCGRGSSQLGKLLRNFAQSHPVVYVRRDRVDLQVLIDGGQHNFDKIYELGNRFYESCSNFDFFNITQAARSPTELDASTLRLKDTERDFVRFLNQILGIPQTLLHSADPLSQNYTYALRVPEEWMMSSDSRFEELETGADAINLEISVDSSVTMSGFLDHTARKLAIIRRNCRQPVILDISFSTILGQDGGSIFLEQSLRLAPDMLTVPLSIPDVPLQRIFAAKGYVKVIGKHHSCVADSLDTILADWRFIYSKAHRHNFAAVRFSCDSILAENHLQWLAVLVEVNKSAELPITCFASGLKGRASLCFNPVLSPVVIPSVADLNLTVKQAQQALYQCFMLPAKRFTILGRSVSYSLSPALHNAAYEIYGMPHTYDVLQTDNFFDINKLFADQSCGGVTVSLPFKSQAFALMNRLSPAAQDIGAVNTVIVKHGGSAASLKSLEGHNTDYIGIRESIIRALSPANAIRDGSTALTIGAGGMARAAIYACWKLGVKRILVYNRTIERAQNLADYYNSWGESNHTSLEVSVLPSLVVQWPANLRQPTIIVSCIPAHSIGGQQPANLVLPDQWLQSPTGGVVVELAYKPVITPLVKQIRQMFALGWIVIDGLDVLVEQGIAQFELFTGRPAPVHAMRYAVQKQYEIASTIPDADDTI